MASRSQIALCLCHWQIGGGEEGYRSLANQLKISDFATLQELLVPQYHHYLVRKLLEFGTLSEHGLWKGENIGSGPSHFLEYDSRDFLKSIVKLVGGRICRIVRSLRQCKRHEMQKKRLFKNSGFLQNMTLKLKREN